jgi:hypothetical protein
MQNSHPLLFLPRTRIPHRIPDPFFQFDGPIQGGADWQARGFRYLHQKLPYFAVAVRNKYDSRHELFLFTVKTHRNSFHNSSCWERYCRDIVLRLKYGCLVFWLPVEDKSQPRHDGGVYGDETRGTLNECAKRFRREGPLNIVIGAEEGFPGLKKIREEFNYASDGSFIFQPTLEATLDAAIEKVAHSLG